VAILGVEAQGQAHSLRVTGEAREMADVVAYVRRLRKSPSIESANLSHHEEKQAGTVKVIRFSLDANWRAPS
jgi:Tfp pilus assembly protein PilN